MPHGRRKERLLDQRSDSELVTATCRGNRTAYADLVRRHYKQIFLVCFGVVGNIHDAEDVAQESMITGLRKIKQLRDRDQFSHWLTRIARNLSVNFVRRKAAEQRAVDRKEEVSPSCADTDPGSDNGNDDLKKAIVNLPWDLRLPLVMYYFDGRNVKAVAKAMDISTSGVYVKLRTAIKELHEILTSQGETS